MGDPNKREEPKREDPSKKSDGGMSAAPGSTPDIKKKEDSGVEKKSDEGESQRL
jgi:hypothetical protein